MNFWIQIPIRGFDGWWDYSEGDHSKGWWWAWSFLRVLPLFLPSPWQMGAGHIYSKEKAEMGNNIKRNIVPVTPGGDQFSQGTCLRGRNTVPCWQPSSCSPQGQNPTIHLQISVVNQERHDCGDVVQTLTIFFASHNDETVDLRTCELRASKIKCV